MRPNVSSSSGRRKSVRHALDILSDADLLDETTHLKDDVMDPQLIADYACKTGEGPLWHPTEKQVYWCDIPNGRLFRFDPSTGEHETFFEGDVVGGFTIQADGKLLLFMARGAIRICDGGDLLTIVDEIEGETSSRFNDVIADPVGRVYCGTMPSPDHLGRLYRLDTDGNLAEIVDEIGCSNGMGFTPDRKNLYYTDSTAKKIYLFDYDEPTGDLTNQRVFLDVGDEEGIPDGMTVDAEGYVWSARWDGSCVVRYDPTAHEVARVGFPARKVSCITFGGDEYADAYVTTAGGDDKANEGDGAGALFRADLGVRGVPEFVSRVGL